MSFITSKSKHRYILGLDPGVKTGLAIWDRVEKKFHTLVTVDILEAVELLKRSKEAWPDELFVRIEDPNQRKWFGKTGREVLQGAGSVKRDFKIIRDYLEKNGIPYHAFAPKDSRTKLDVKQFGKITGCTVRTSQHARDAAMSVYGF